ncbi:S-layer homology domain-containing protein [Sporosarcina sp. FSL W7-1349]|uniref:S-layer homology domain-containing protein n=1 Tax=Sporosarcina sp. FSL W7-1349 TaxID=2921561 RepID=UPI0030FC9C89
MKNKFTAAGMALLLVFAALPIQAQAAAQFSDVKTHWAKNEIKYLSDRNIIGGYPDGTFKPNEPITRAQASAMLIKALNIPLTENTSVQFKDVAKNSPYYQILATVNEKGVLRGDNGYMRPGEKTSRAQMAAILRRAFDLPLDKQATFIDVTPAHWAYQDINGIAKQRIAGGSDGKYMPSNSVTRAQFSAFLVRALDDKMKLSKYHSYVSTKGKTVEQEGFIYFTERDTEHRYSVMKENKETGKREVLLRDVEVPRSDWDYDPRFLHDNTRLVLYNDELYIPYWSGAFAEADEVPYAFDVMKIKTDGQELVKIMEPSGRVMLRNLFIWNDRIYFTDTDGWSPRAVSPDEFEDGTLVLYSTPLGGLGNKRKELVFDARVTFDHYDEKLNQPNLNREAGGENLSVLYDHSTIYYFNKKGVFKYNLLDKKTSKLSTILGKRMEVTETQLIVTDVKGKKHSLKK